MPEHAPEDDALVRLASKLVRVKAHRRTTKGGKTEQVKSYVRKDLAARADLGTGKTKSGAFSGAGASSPVLKSVAKPVAKGVTSDRERTRRLQQAGKAEDDARAARLAKKNTPTKAPVPTKSEFNKAKKYIGERGGVGFDKTHEQRKAEGDKVTPAAPAAPAVPAAPAIHVHVHTGGGDAANGGGNNGNNGNNGNGGKTPDLPGKHDDAALKADAKAYSDSLSRALDGEDVPVPTYSTQHAHLDKIDTDTARSMTGVKALSPDDVKSATEDAKKPAIKRMLQNTPAPVLLQSFKDFATKTGKKFNRMRALTFAALVDFQFRTGSEHENKFDKNGKPKIKYHGLESHIETSQTLFDLSDPLPELVHSMIEAAHHVGPVVEALTPAVRAWLGLSAVDEDNVALSKLVKVQAHRRHAHKGGKTEHVRAYVRKNLDARSDIGFGKTKAGAFNTPDRVDLPERMAPSLGKGGSSNVAKTRALQHDSTAFIKTMDKALDGHDIKIPKYRTEQGPIGNVSPKISEKIADDVNALTDDDVSAAAKDAAKPQIQALLKATPVQVLMQALQDLIGRIGAKIRRMRALAFAALVDYQHRTGTEKVDRHTGTPEVATRKVVAKVNGVKPGETKRAYHGLEAHLETYQAYFDSSDVTGYPTTPAEIAEKLAEAAHHVEPIVRALGPTVLRHLGVHLSGSQDDSVADGDDTDNVALASAPDKQNLQSKGQAFKNGSGDASFPIRNVNDLRNAIQAFGRAKDEDKPRLKRFIMARARALGKADLIPDSWTKVEASNAIEALDIALTRHVVVVPPHTRVVDGRAQQVSGYTYTRQSKSLPDNHGKAKVGTFNPPKPVTDAFKEARRGYETEKKADHLGQSTLATPAKGYPQHFNDPYDLARLKDLRQRNHKYGHKVEVPKVHSFANLSPEGRSTTDPFDINPADDPIRVGSYSEPPNPADAERLHAREIARRAAHEVNAALFPIHDANDLLNAIPALDQAKDEDKPFLKRFIMARAQALGKPDLIPDSWTKVEASNPVDLALTDTAVELARTVHVDRHTRRSKTGHTEDVDPYTYVRKDLGSFLGGDAHTRTASIGGDLTGRGATYRPPSVKDRLADLGSEIAWGQDKATHDAWVASTVDEMMHDPQEGDPNAGKMQRPGAVEAAGALHSAMIGGLSTPDDLVRFEPALRSLHDVGYDATAKDVGDWMAKVNEGRMTLEQLTKKVNARIAKLEKYHGPYMLSVEETADLALEVTLAGRLDFSPKHNWVEDAGGLPKYIEDIAIALIRDHGMKREQAIPIAISRVKKWASGVGNVNADTRAKAAAALAQWEALKAKSGAKSAAKKAGKAAT